MSFAEGQLKVLSKIRLQDYSADAKICSLVAKNVQKTELSVMFASQDTCLIRTETYKSVNPATCGVNFA